MCMGCGGRFAKSSLVRFTVEDAGGARTVALDPDGSRPGRGAYLCASRQCFDKAMAKKMLLRRLAADAAHPDIEEQFIDMLENHR
jgi:predicted RNA-binding protein YlxR (DUF448 family)